MFVSTQAFSSSTDEEDLQDTRYDSLDWMVWKAAIEKDMRDLKKKVLELEQKSSGGSSKKGPDKLSFANAEDDGCGGLCTCARLIRKRKAALLQCIWLAIFVVALTSVGTVQFLRVKNNRQAEFKPEKKSKTLNYAESDNNLTYEMPYVYIHFVVFSELETQWSSENVNETLEQLLQSQNYFQEKAKIAWLNNDLLLEEEVLPIDEAIAFYREGYIHESRFLGCFRLKFGNPDPSIGSFVWELYINMPDMTLDETLMVAGVWVSLAKQESTLNWGSTIRVSTATAVINKSKIFATIDYTEKVTHTWDEGSVNYFASTLVDYNEVKKPNILPLSDDGLLTIEFKWNSIIEHWEEYVDYDYYDWLSGMGGMISLASTLFFWGAYRLAVIFEEGFSMGILPEMSFIFENKETIGLVKQQVNTL